MTTPQRMSDARWAEFGGMCLDAQSHGRELYQALKVDRAIVGQVKKIIRNVEQESATELNSPDFYRQSGRQQVCVCLETAIHPQEPKE